MKLLPILFAAMGMLLAGCGGEAPQDNWFRDSMCFSKAGFTVKTEENGMAILNIEEFGITRGNGIRTQFLVNGRAIEQVDGVMFIDSKGFSITANAPYGRSEFTRIKEQFERCQRNRPTDANGYHVYTDTSVVKGILTQVYGSEFVGEMDRFFE